MDKTIKYAKMSEEAKKIQELLKDEFDWSRQGYCIQHKYFIKVNSFGSPECPGWAEIYEANAVLASESENCFEFDRWIGLPYQDQLQEIVLAIHKWTAVDLVWHFSEWATKATNEWGNSIPFGSTEQLLIQFVMKEKYNKTWDDENEKWN